MRPTLFLLINACTPTDKSDTTLPETGAADTGHSPDGGLLDITVEATPICGETEVPITLRNVGTASLSIEADPVIEPPDHGWSMASELPAGSEWFNAGEDQDWSLLSTGGEARLRILTSAGWAEEDLSSTAATTTTLSLATDLGDSTLPRDGDVVLTATVTSGDLPVLAGTLVTFWAGATVLGSAALDEGGQAQLAWPAADRLAYTGDLTLSATLIDACDVPVSATLPACAQGVVDVEAMDLSTVKTYGATVFEASSIILLTEDAAGQAGSAFFTEPVGAGYHLRFEVWLGENDLSGGGGLVFIAKETTDTSDPMWLGETGCALGYTDTSSCSAVEDYIPGYAIEFDTRQFGAIDGGDWAPDDSLEGEEDQIAVVQDGDMEAPLTDTMVPNLEDGLWHSVEVRVDEVRGELEIRLDEQQQLLVEGLDESFYQDHWLGFSASTADEGEATNAQKVRYIERVEQVCP